MSVRIAAGGAAADAIERVVPRLVARRVASSLAAQDPDLWGPAAVEHASSALGWTEAVGDSRSLTRRIEELREELTDRGLDHVVLCAAGGTAIAAQVIAATQGVELVVLDSAEPSAMGRVLADRIERTVVVVSAPGNLPVEIEAALTAVVEILTAAGLDPGERLVVVADEGGPLAERARGAGYRFLPSAPRTGAAFAALTAAALVPAGLAGADLGALLDEAESELLDVAMDGPTNNALVLAAAIAGAEPRPDALVVVADGTHIVGFGDWIEQLVAAATGRDGSGLLPVVVERGAPEAERPPAGVQVLRLVDEATDARHDRLLAAGEVLLSGSLGELILVLEVAVAVGASLIGVDPFAPPDADAVDRRARQLLADRPAAEPPRFTERGASVRSHGLDLEAEAGLRGAVGALLGAAPGGSTAVIAYADPAGDGRLAAVRDVLARRTGRLATFGWGPRSLRAAGQARLGGSVDVAVLLLTVAGADAGSAPTGLTAALSGAEAEALGARGIAVLHVHLAGEDAVDALLAAVAE